MARRLAIRQAGEVVFCTRAVEPGLTAIVNLQTDEIVATFKHTGKPQYASDAALALNRCFMYAAPSRK